jgi:hypothetical protein
VDDCLEELSVVILIARDDGDGEMEYFLTRCLAVVQADSEFFWMK